MKSWIKFIFCIYAAEHCDVVRYIFHRYVVIRFPKPNCFCKVTCFPKSGEDPVHRYELFEELLETECFPQSTL